jgi:hypothetical protein
MGIVCLHTYLDRKQCISANIDSQYDHSDLHLKVVSQPIIGWLEHKRKANTQQTKIQTIEIKHSITSYKQSERNMLYIILKV